MNLETSSLMEDVAKKLDASSEAQVNSLMVLNGDEVH